MGIRIRDGDGTPSVCVAISKWALSHTQVHLQEDLTWPLTSDLLLSQPRCTEQVTCYNSYLQPFTPHGDPSLVRGVTFSGLLITLPERPDNGYNFY